MKKILFSAYDMDLGGIETSLLTLLNFLAQKKENNEKIDSNIDVASGENFAYEITLVLEKKEGIFLKDLDPRIKVIEYKVYNDKNPIIRKLKNYINQQKFKNKYKNKFDFSASYATYSNAGSFISRVASQNSAIWCHADYLTLFDNNVKKMKDFFEEKSLEKFRKIVFVSEEGKKSFIEVFPELKNKVYVCNNMIDYKKILRLASEPKNTAYDSQDENSFDKKIQGQNIDKKVQNNNSNNISKPVIFLNVGRHDEKQKKLSRIIEATEMLKDENENFKVLFVGAGQDTEKYKNMVKEKGLEKYIIFLGSKKNPYPYFKMADCVVLSSDYEGYPVVFLESFAMQRPIITTAVSDYNEVKGRGIITEKSAEGIYKAMKKFINNKEQYEYKNLREFNPAEYNENIYKKILKIIEE